VSVATGGSVTTFRLIALVLVVAIAGTLVQPARAEAIEPMTVLAIAGVAVGVILVIVIVVIANIRERQTAMVEGEPVVVALDAERAPGL